ncbi:hypothetical protein O3G_MSEX002277 [Manduca sexta]|nr:hypothetical protein O3G_MSEX002277 [Manduca sexta]
MTMPPELSLPVQRVLRTVISGVMLAQCFTVYVYLASYIVLLYPVFLEERPALVLPWLLLAAIRKLLCELTSLSLGLGTCVLLGPAKPPCIKFLVVKVVSIMPAFYMWMLVFSYYHVLKVASAFKTFPPVLPSTDLDYGLELAVRRRRTKSLLGEDQLRRKLEASFCSERHGSLIEGEALQLPPVNLASNIASSTDTSVEDMKDNLDSSQPMSITSNRMSDAGTFEDWFGNEVVIPRDTDRILEQFVLMLLRISVYLTREGSESLILRSFSPRSQTISIRTDLDCPVMPSDTDTPHVTRCREDQRPSYLRDYPEMFTRKSSDIPLSSRRRGSIRTVQKKSESDDGNITKQYKRAVSINSNEKVSLEIEKVVNKKKQTMKRNERKRDPTTKLKYSLKINEVQSNSIGTETVNERKNSQNESTGVGMTQTSKKLNFKERRNNPLTENNKSEDESSPEQKGENGEGQQSSQEQHKNLDNNNTQDNLSK